jgi:hypothetical protein
LWIVPFPASLFFPYFQFWAQIKAVAELWIALEVAEWTTMQICLAKIRDVDVRDEVMRVQKMPLCSLLNDNKLLLYSLINFISP